MPDEAIILTEEDWKALTLALEEPPAPNERLREFLAAKSPWEVYPQPEKEISTRG